MIPRVVARRTGRWIDNRLRLSSVSRHAIAKIFPDHWSFMLGEIALYSFLILVVTGVYLTLFFVPDTTEKPYRGSYLPLHGEMVSSAYDSTVRLSWDVPAGLLMRQTHHWAALIFVGAIVLHLCRIFFTAAFRKPREINWLVGVTMLLLAMGNGFAGYSMPDDLLSGTGLRIAWSVLLAVPVVGPWLAFGLFGTEFPGESLIPRLYALHILVVPALLAVLITVHMAVLIRQKHTHFPGPGRRNSTVVGSRLWPTYAIRSLALLSAVAAMCFLLGGLVQINPIWLWGPYHPAAVTNPAQPDWYVGWVDGALRIFPPWDWHIGHHLIPALVWPGLVMPGVTFLVVYLWPWIDRRLFGDREEHHVLERVRDHPGRVAVGVWALFFYGLLLAAGADDLVARYLRVPILTVMETMRAVVLAVPLVAGAVAYWLARRLRDSDVESFSQLSLHEALPAATRRHEPEGEPRRVEMGEQLPVDSEDAPPVPVPTPEDRQA